MTYIYGLHCPLAMTIRYVGKSNDPKKRLVSHLCSCTKSSHYAARWLAKLKNLGMRPTLVILAEVGEGEDWREAERAMIESGPSMGWRLTNTTPGGEGGGFVRPEDKAEWIRKVRDSLSKEEVRQKISAGVKLAYKDQATHAKAVNRMKARWQCDDYRQHMRQMEMEANARPESRKARSTAGKKRMGDEAERKAISQKLKAYYATEEGKRSKKEVSSSADKREASRSAQLRNWQDPEYRAANLLAKNRPDVIERQSSMAGAQWSDPQMRAKMVQGLKDAWVRRRAAKNGEIHESESH